MYFQITNAAVAALATNPALRQTTYKLGTGTGYVPQATDTNIHGTSIYQTALSNGNIINGNVLRYSLLLPKDLILSQAFGEIGLYTDSGMLFALGVMDTPVVKSNSYSMRIDAYLSSVDVNYETWLDLAESSNAFHMGIIQSVDQLPSGANATPNAVIVRQGLLESFRAFSGGAGLWVFDEYATTGTPVTVVSANTQSVTIALSSYVGPSTVDSMAPPIVEFTTGFLFSVCRQLTNISVSNNTVTLVWATPVVQAPIVGDQFIVFLKRPKTISAGNGIAVTTGQNGLVTITNTGGIGTVWRNSIGSPSNTVGNEGDYWLNDATGDVYQKVSGVYTIVANLKGAPGTNGTNGTNGKDGTNGTNGTNGANGTNGNTIISGTGNPSNTVGNNGDFFLAQDTAILWGPKVSGAWPGSGTQLQSPMKSYAVSLYVEGQLTSSEVLLVHCAPVAYTLPVGLSGSFAKSTIAATASTVFVIKKNGSQIGTATFAVGAQSATFSFTTATSFVAGDVLEIDGPATPDSTLANIGFTFVGTLGSNS